MKAEYVELIKQLIPFNQLGEGDLTALLDQLKVVKYPAGKMIFKRNEQDDQVYWVLTGSVDLLDEKFDARNRKAGDDVTRNPIDNNSPHRLTAVTTEESRILISDRSTMSIHLGGASSGAAAAPVEEEGIDWMSTLLSSPLFEFVPPSNIQTLFSRFEEVKCEAGEVVITQGEQGDYFYVIQAGRAKVERTAGEKKAVLAELKPGDNFGQDALVSDTPRNATVTMTSNGTLMRLSAPDFQSLIMSPVIETVNMEEAQEMIRQGDPRTYIVDVRTPSEYEADKITGSINIPLLLLRKNLRKLKDDAVYLCMSDDGKRAQLGAYQMNEEGYSAYVLKRGGEQ